MQRIPEVFQSSKEYFNSFVFPLLEETRAKMFSAMETICEAPYARVTGLWDSKPFGEGSCEVNVEEWNTGISHRGKEPYKILLGDVFVLANIKPETASDMKRIGTMWNFISITKIAKDQKDNPMPLSFKVKMLKDIETDELKDRSLFMVYLTNVLPDKRIWISLHLSENLKTIKEILYSSSVVSI